MKNWENIDYRDVEPFREDVPETPVRRPRTRSERTDAPHSYKPVFFWIFATIIFIVTLLYLFSSLQNAYISDRYFNKENFIVINKDDRSENIIFQRVSDTTYYSDMNKSTALTNLKERWDSFYFIIKVGDTLYFDYINKDRFFRRGGKPINRE